MLGNGLFGGANPEEITGFYTGLRLDDGADEWARYDIGEDNINLGANGSTITTVISFWHKNNNPIEENQNLQRVMGNEGTTTDYVYIDIDTFNPGTGFETTRRLYLRSRQSSTAPPSGVGWNWDTGVGVTDSDWHHYCIHITLTSGAFPGNYRADAYVDGVYKGQSYASGPGTYGASVNLDSPYIGFGRAIDNTVVYSDFCIGQFGVWKIAKTDFNINDFYFNGAVNLGTDGRQGTTQLLNTPLIYITFDYPFSNLDLFEGDTAKSFGEYNKCNWVPPLTTFDTDEATHIYAPAGQDLVANSMRTDGPNLPEYQLDNVANLPGIIILNGTNQDAFSLDDVYDYEMILYGNLSTQNTSQTFEVAFYRAPILPAGNASDIVEIARWSSTNNSLTFNTYKQINMDYKPNSNYFYWSAENVVVGAGSASYININSMGVYIIRSRLENTGNV